MKKSLALTLSLLTASSSFANTTINSTGSSFAPTATVPAVTSPNLGSGISWSNVMSAVNPSNQSTNSTRVSTAGFKNSGPGGNIRRHPGTENACSSVYEPAFNLIETDLQQFASEIASTEYKVRLDNSGFGNVWATWGGYTAYLTRKIAEYYLGTYITELVGIGAILSNGISVAWTAASIALDLEQALALIASNGGNSSGVDWSQVQTTALYEALLPYKSNQITNAQLYDLADDYWKDYFSTVPPVVNTDLRGIYTTEVRNVALTEENGKALIRTTLDPKLDLQFGMKYGTVVEAYAWFFTNLALWRSGIPLFIPFDYFMIKKDYNRSVRLVNKSDRSQLEPIDLTFEYTPLNGTDGAMVLDQVINHTDPTRGAINFDITQFNPMTYLEPMLGQWSAYTFPFLSSLVLEVFTTHFQYADVDTRHVINYARATRKIVNERRRQLNGIQLEMPKTRISNSLGIDTSWSQSISPFETEFKQNNNGALGFYHNAEVKLPVVSIANLDDAVTPALPALPHSHVATDYNSESVLGIMAQLQRQATATRAELSRLPTKLSTEYFHDGEGLVQITLDNISFGSPTFSHSSDPLAREYRIRSSSNILADIDIKVDGNTQISAQQVNLPVTSVLKEFVDKFKNSQKYRDEPAGYAASFGPYEDGDEEGKPFVRFANFNHPFLRRSDVEEAITGMLSSIISTDTRAAGGLLELKLHRVKESNHLSWVSELKNQGFNWLGGSGPGVFNKFSLRGDVPAKLKEVYKVPDVLTAGQRNLASSSVLDLNMTIQDRGENIVPTVDYIMDGRGEPFVVHCTRNYTVTDSKGNLVPRQGQYSVVTIQPIKNIEGGVDLGWDGQSQSPTRKLRHSFHNDLSTYQKAVAGNLNQAPVPPECRIDPTEVDLQFKLETEGYLRHPDNLGHDAQTAYIGINKFHDRQDACIPRIDYVITPQSLSIAPKYAGKIEQGSIDQKYDYKIQICSDVNTKFLSWTEGGSGVPIQELPNGPSQPVAPPYID